MKHQLLLTAMLLTGISWGAAQSVFDDDIYYNPKNDKSTQTQKTQTTKKKQSNYIADFSSMDVDTYNRRGEQYYATPVDTIGSYVENGEDFVYTQEIQKYYNPTIVVDNAAVLGDVLSNAYGNVEIVINDNGIPVFTPYYAGWWASPSWRFNYGLWGWNIGFYDPWYWGPSWSWGWGPTWAWGPSWSWGWGPAWGPGWGPAHRPGWGPRPPMASWSPNGHRPAGVRPGWSHNTRPGGNMAHRQPARPGWSTSTRPGASSRPGNSATRPGGNARPGSTQTRPAGGHAGVVNNNGRWEYNTTRTTGHRQQGTGVVNSGRGQNSGTVNSSTNRGSTSNRSNSGYNRSNNTNRSNNNSSYNRSNNSNRSSNRSSSYNPSRSSGGNFGGSRSTGGGSRGGSRGGRR